MRIKQIALLTGLVLALAAFAAPGASATFQITDSGEPVEDIEFETTGEMRYETLGTGVECTVHQRVTADGTTTAITQIEFTPETCVSFGFLYAGCEVESVTSTSMPLAVTVTKDGLEYSSELDFQFGGEGCFMQGEVKTVTKTIDHPINKFSETDPNGVGWENIVTSTCSTKLGEIEEIGEGTSEVVGGAAGTYEIG